VSPALRRNALPAVAVLLVLVEAGIRAALGRPYPGSTLLLLAACGIALLRFVPGELQRPSLAAAVVPALGIGSFAVLLTTVSIAGVRLNETSIRLSTAALVIALAAVSIRIRAPEPVWRGSLGRELLLGGALVVLVAYAFASSWDLAYPFQLEGSDVGHYLLYADEVATQGHLLIDDPYSGDDRVFADPPAVGAVYGSALILDDVSSWTLAWGLLAVSAISVLSVFATAGALWGAGAGLAAGAAYAVAPIRLDTMYWHGLGTSLALVFLPLVVLALGLMYRGARDWRAIGLLGFALVSVAASHSTSAIVVAVVVALAPVIDVVRHALAQRSGPIAAVRSSWRDGVTRPVVLGVAVAAILGLGVLAHLRLLSERLGRPVDYRFLGPDWLDRAAVSGYFSWSFLVFSAIALALVLSSRRLRRDPAVLALLALGLACVVIGQLWRIHVPFEYRRSVYYLGIALVLVIGLAFVRLRPRAIGIVAFVLALGFVARGAVGLGLPERVLEGSRPESPAVTGLNEFRRRLDTGELPEARVLVTDGCLHFAVAYFVRRPTLPAFSERQVGFVDRLPLARDAARVLAGGPDGRALARQLGVDYVVADPRCVGPDLAKRVEGTVVAANDELVVVRLPTA
jgi:hypothetical protein